MLFFNLKSSTFSTGWIIFLAPTCFSITNNLTLTPQLGPIALLPKKLPTLPPLPPLPSPLPAEVVDLNSNYRTVVLSGTDGKSLIDMNSVLKSDDFFKKLHEMDFFNFAFDVTRYTIDPPKITLRSATSGLYLSIAHNLSAAVEKNELNATLSQNSLVMWDFSYDDSMFILRDPLGYYLCSTNSGIVGMKKFCNSCRFRVQSFIRLTSSPAGGGVSKFRFG